MNLETILNAMENAGEGIELRGDWQSLARKRERQYRAFRARILREFAIYKNFADANGFDRSQAWYWTDEWQAAEREADEDRAFLGGPK